MPRVSRLEQLIEELRCWCLNTSRYAISKVSGVAQSTLASANSRDTWNPQANTLIALDRARARMQERLDQGQEDHRKLHKSPRLPM